MTGRDFHQPGLFQQYGAILLRLARLIDAGVIVGALFVVVHFSGQHWGGVHLAVALLAVLLFELIASFFEFYRSWRIVRFRYEIAGLALYWSITSLLVTFVVVQWSEGAVVDSHVLIPWFVGAFLFIFLFRLLMRFFLRYFRAFGYDARVAAFVGANEISARLAETFRSHPWMGIDILGFFDDRAPDGDRPLAVPKAAWAGNVRDLIERARRGEVDVIYIALPLAAELRIKRLIDAFADTTVSIHYCPSFFEFGLLNARWDNVYGQPVVSVVETPFNGTSAMLKRVEDLALTAAILPIIALPMLLISTAVKLTSRGPVFYWQTRYGLDGREFKVCKFRTMYTTEGDDDFVQAAKGDPRITPVGAFLRKTSLDELPQFLSVLKGDMSVIGPRPHPVMLNETHRTQIHRYMVRHKVKPGITGLAQINGFRGETRDLAAMEQRVQYDLQYIRNWSLWLDFKIFIKTLFLVFNDKNAY